MCKILPKTIHKLGKFAIAQVPTRDIADTESDVIHFCPPPLGPSGVMFAITHGASGVTYVFDAGAFRNLINALVNEELEAIAALASSMHDGLSLDRDPDE